MAQKNQKKWIFSVHVITSTGYINRCDFTDFKNACLCVPGEQALQRLSLTFSKAAIFKVYMDRNKTPHQSVCYVGGGILVDEQDMPCGSGRKNTMSNHESTVQESKSHNSGRVR